MKNFHKKTSSQKSFKHVRSFTFQFATRQQKRIKTFHFQFLCSLWDRINIFCEFFFLVSFVIHSTRHKVKIISANFIFRGHSNELYFDSLPGWLAIFFSSIFLSLNFSLLSTVVRGRSQGKSLLKFEWENDCKNVSYKKI